ncbi:unnamed protein product, partial [Echinostoma caproni]|uniref:MRG domain-containing protein n=1 Tax=Echinostoma caproni TaxID=27848 RepID=A0A183AMA2_9TREM
KDPDVEQTSENPDSPVNSDREAAEETATGLSESVPVPVDVVLKGWLDYATTTILPLADPRKQAEELGKFVASCYGGPVDKATLSASYHELNLAEIKCSIESNVIPLGRIKKGSQFHRGLLFKFLADHIGLPTNLVRGNYGRTYNELLLRSTTNAPKPTMIPYVVDLMLSPGMLMDPSSSEAKEYVSILSQ